MAALGGMDALVFSAGIGEHDAVTRAEVVPGRTGSALSSTRIAILAAISRISADNSAVSVWAVPTDEERLIARHTAAVLS